jgi:general nucleoside transport system ATP-binding protein
MQRAGSHRMTVTPLNSPASTPQPAPALQLHGISKRFGELVAVDAITLELQRGEVLALLGENGAGKSTLVSILFGHYVADAGHIEVAGQRLPPGQPKAALAAGIGMVHQHFTLAENLSVLDNVLLGTEALWQPFSRRDAARRRLLDAAQRFGLAVDPDALVAELSVGERQRVEILKALLPGGRAGAVKILILDEPTAVLTPQESESLFATLAQLVAAGLSIIFISHKLDEVLRVSQRIAVLRAGRLVALLPRAQADATQLAEAMVGRRVPPAVRHERVAGTVVAELREVVLRPGGQPLSLSVRAGEVLAIAGVAGNGQQALAELMCGERAALTGEVLHHADAGIARIPEDRQELGVVGDLPLWENTLLERYAAPEFSRRTAWRRGAAWAFAQALIERFDVRGAQAAGVATVTRALSGGNMQKLILGRVLFRASPQLVVANQPTWGLDVGAVAYIHQQLLDACAAGSAVLLISEDLDEIFAIADRVAVMHRGVLTQALPTREWSLATMGLAMAGSAAARETHAA